MAIQAVNGFKSNINSYNDISFQGKKNKTQTEVPSSTSTLKAIPLAVMIAMSPLTPINSKTASGVGEPQQTSKEMTSNPGVKEVSVKKYVLDEKYDVAIELSYLDTDKNPSTIEALRLYFELRPDPSDTYDFDEYMGLVTSVDDYNYTLRGDDGRKLGDMSFSMVKFFDENDNRIYSFASDELVKDVKKFVASSKSKTIKHNTWQKNIYPSKNTAFTTSNASNAQGSLIDRIKQAGNYNFGTVVRTGTYKTEQGNYKLNYISNDGNPKNYEALVIERDDGLKFKLDGLRIQNIIMYNGLDAQREAFPLGCIDISWPNVGKFVIYDNELWNALYEMAHYKDYSECIKVSQSDLRIRFTEDGKFKKLVY